MNQFNEESTAVVSKFDFFNAVSLASDIFERIRIGHSRRVAYTAVKLAERLLLPMEDICNLYYTAILHDLGTGDAFNEASMKNQDADKEAHVLYGNRIINEFFQTQIMHDAVLDHHENWDGSGLLGKKGKDISLFGQILRISDFLDTTFDRSKSYSEAKREIHTIIEANRGVFFSENITDLFLETTDAEHFWLDYKHENINGAFHKIALFDTSRLNLDEMIKYSRVCAKIVDQKSKYTLFHSTTIAANMQAVAAMKGLSATLQKKACLTGLLHDLGKVSVLSSILNKPGPLSVEERHHVNSHSYFTGMILQTIPNFSDVAKWAANHHELLDGHGYPCHLQNEELDYFSRLITVCDVYQALTEERPYRKAMAYDEAWMTIREMRDQGKLCAEASADLKNVVDSKSKRFENQDNV